MDESFKCKKCGNEFEKVLGVCPKCGAIVGKNSNTEEPTVNNTDAENPVFYKTDGIDECDNAEITLKTKKRFWAIFTAVALAVIIILGAILPIVLSNSSSKSKTASVQKAKTYSPDEIKAAYLRMDYSIIAASILSVDKDATFYIFDADGDGTEELFANALYDDDFYTAVTYVFDPDYDKKCKVLYCAGNSAFSKIKKSEKYGVVLEESFTYYPESGAEYSKWNGNDWEKVFSFSFSNEEEYANNEPQIDELGLVDFTDKGFAVCSNYFNALNTDEIIDGYVESFSTKTAEGFDGFYGSEKEDFDGDGHLESVIYIGSYFNTWFENVEDLNYKYDGSIFCTTDDFSAFLYLDGCENGILANLFNLSEKLDASSGYKIENENGILKSVLKLNSKSEYVSDWFVLADAKDCANKTDEFANGMAELKIQTLSNLGYTDLNFVLADVCEADGKEILISGKNNDGYYFAVYSLYNGRPVEIYRNFNDNAYYLYSNGGSDRLLSFFQKQYSSLGEYIQEYSYRLFYFDRQFMLQEDDTSSIHIPLNSAPGEKENEFFEKFNKYKEHITVCIDPYGLTGYDLIPLDKHNADEYLKITNCNTDKSGTVNVEANSWLNFREGPGLSYDKVLINPSDKTSFVRQMKGSSVTVIDTANIDDDENPIWIEIEIVYADRVLEGYSSQKYIDLGDIKTLSVGESFKIETDSSNKNLTWQVNDTDKADIDISTGKITAKATGLVTVTVEDENGLFDTCLINIK